MATNLEGTWLKGKREDAKMAAISLAWGEVWEGGREGGKEVGREFSKA